VVEGEGLGGVGWIGVGLALGRWRGGGGEAYLRGSPWLRVECWRGAGSAGGFEKVGWLAMSCCLAVY